MGMRIGHHRIGNNGVLPGGSTVYGGRDEGLDVCYALSVFLGPRLPYSRDWWAMRVGSGSGLPAVPLTSGLA